MKVFILINSLAPGGAERSLIELLPALPAHDIDAHVICLRDTENGWSNDVRKLGTPLTVLSGRSLPTQVAQVRSLVRRERPDLIHTSLFEADLVGRAAGIRGPAVLTTLANVAYDPARWCDPSVAAWKLQVARLIESTSGTLLTDHFHAISDSVKQSSVTRLRLRPETVTTIPRGRDRERLGLPTPQRRRETRAALDIDDDAPVVLTIGRQEYQKGQQYLIDAFDQVVKRHPRAVLLIAGRPGAATTRLQGAARQSSAPDAIRFLGHRRDVADLLTAADVFAFPSLYEGLGGAVLEAMAMRCPIVASDLAPLREYLTHDESAQLVPRADAEGLGSSLLRVIEARDEAHRLAAVAADVFEEQFDLTVINNRMVGLYRAVSGIPDRSLRHRA